MDYGKLGPSESNRSYSNPPPVKPNASTTPSSRRKRFFLLAITATLFLAASAASISLLLRSKNRRHSQINRAPSLAISRTCKLTQYPELCISSLVNFPGALEAGERELVHVSLNMTHQRVGAALYGASSISGVSMDRLARAAYDDCVELLDNSIEQLSQSIHVVSGGGGATDEDALTWLSAALTNHDTCAEGLDGVETYVREELTNQLKDLAELVSNSLAIFAAASRSKEFSTVPIEDRKRRRRLLSSGFPDWVNPTDRKLLETPAQAIQADFVVAKDGSGTHKTITDAVKAAPESSSRRIIIYVKSGRYEENIKVARKKINLMFVGDGMGNTVVAGTRSVYDKFTTFHTATFAATGSGLIMKEMTIENNAGPEKHQAVALRVGADRAVVYHCSIIGFQDSLYVHSQRQFFRECDIFGTVDFIFGNAAVVLQKCNIWARKPMDRQKNTITAQNRKDPNQNTGISIHDCQIKPTSDLSATNGNVQTFLGRPWKLYSRVVYMLSYMGNHIDPAGWLEWNGDFALSTLYYGEYMNYGPGAGVGKRVNWPGYRTITVDQEAEKFTVAKFIYGSSWLPSTGVAYLAGLSV